MLCLIAPTRNRYRSNELRNLSPVHRSHPLLRDRIHTESYTCRRATSSIRSALPTGTLPGGQPPDPLPAAAQTWPHAACPAAAITFQSTTTLYRTAPPLETVYTAAYYMLVRHLVQLPTQNTKTCRMHARPGGQASRRSFASYIHDQPIYSSTKDSTMLVPSIP